MSDALAKAFDAASRMRSVKATTAERIVTSGLGPGSTMRMPNTAAEQFRHLRGWVWSAVRLIATRVAGQSVHVGRKATGPRRGKALGTDVEPLHANPLLDLLDRPNDYQTCGSLLWSLVASLEVTGRALLWCPADRRTLLHVPTNWLVSVDAKRTAWTIRPDGATDEFDLPGDEVVNLAFPDPSDPLGCVNPLSRFAEAILTDEEIGTAQYSAFRNGLFPKVVLTAGRLPGTPDGGPGQRPVLEPEQRADLITAIKGAYAGTLRSDEPFIIDGLIERIDKFSHSLAEMDFVDSAKLTKAKVLQAYGVSPILLGEVEGANRASATVADEILCSSTVNPLIELVSQGLTRWLAPMFASPREKLCVWIEPAVAHDPELQLKRWELGLRHGVVTGDEYRVRVLNIEAAGLGEFQTPAMMLPRTQRSLRVNGDAGPYTLERLAGAN